MTVTVLFCESDGIYPKIENTDCYDIKRNALTFTGDNPIVAHPPCQLWGKFAKINYKRWGGDHNRPKNDGGLFLFALNSVRKNGGVLEHPAYSYAFDEYDIEKPDKNGWKKISKNEYVCEVWQSAYGHLASKKTWLFYCGEKPHDLKWEQKKGSYQIGFYDQRGKEKNKPTISGKMASATPVAFAKELIALAQNCKRD